MTATTAITPIPSPQKGIWKGNQSVLESSPARNDRLKGGPDGNSLRAVVVRKKFTMTRGAHDPSDANQESRDGYAPRQRAPNRSGRSIADTPSFHVRNGELGPFARIDRRRVEFSPSIYFSTRRSTSCALQEV